MTSTAPAPSRRDLRATRGRTSRWRRTLRHPIAHLVIALTVIALVQAFAVKVYQVPSESMNPTLRPGDRILIDRVTTALGHPERGDLVVFSRPLDWTDGTSDQHPAWRVAVGWIGDTFGFGPTNSDTLVKRVVAIPGDTLGCCDSTGRMLLNGEPLDEPYLQIPVTMTSACGTDAASPQCFDPIVLANDEYIVAGDNRAVSVDSISGCRGASSSSCARTVSSKDIVGVVFYRFWPITTIGGVGGD